jgi:hypothetical protein
VADVPQTLPERIHGDVLGAGEQRRCEREIHGLPECS